MKHLRTLRFIWAAYVISTLIVAAMTWWALNAGRVSTTGAGLSAIMVPLLAVVTVVEFGIALWLFQRKWRPLCEQSLKLVWAGRLNDPAGARTVVQRLHRLSMAFMGICEAPAIFGFQLAVMGASAPAASWWLIASSLVGLMLVYWHVVQAASDVFRHAERIAKP